MDFKVIDLAEGRPASAEEDHILLTPTLVQRNPLPRTWVVGDLEDTHPRRGLAGPFRGRAEAMTAIRKLPTGVPGLDIITYGGIPQGRTTLITGKSGAGKSILSLQIACNLARTGIKTLVLAIEETPEDLITTADTLGFDWPDG